MPLCKSVITKRPVPFAARPVVHHRDISAKPEEVCRFFEAPETAEFVIIQHIRRTEKDVIAVSLGYLPEKYAEKMHGAIPQSLFAFLEESEGIYISRASTELFIPAEHDPLCEMLRLREGQSAFGFRQCHYDSRGNPTLYSVDYLRSDLFHFTIMRIRP